VTHWEYKAVTVREDKPGYTTDEDLGDRLTNLARPGTDDENYADGWEIFAVRALDDGQVRLYMKRPASSE